MGSNKLLLRKHTSLKFKKLMLSIESRQSPSLWDWDSSSLKRRPTCKTCSCNVKSQSCCSHQFFHLHTTDLIHPKVMIPPSLPGPHQQQVHPNPPFLLWQLSLAYPPNLAWSYGLSHSKVTHPSLSLLLLPTPNSAQYRPSPLPVT